MKSGWSMHQVQEHFKLLFLEIFKALEETSKNLRES